MNVFRRLLNDVRAIRNFGDDGLRLARFVRDLQDNQYVSREFHEKRVRELLAANEREVDRRRAAERELWHLEMQRLHEARIKKAGVRRETVDIVRPQA
jgi:hypothetical protein